MRSSPLAILFVLGCCPWALAQPYESLGVRALGMGGAFVAVADDATAAYWNPAGLVHLRERWETYAEMLLREEIAVDESMRPTPIEPIGQP